MRILVVLAMAIGLLGCSPQGPSEEERARVESAIASAEAKEGPMEEAWKRLMADATAGEIIPETGEPCPVKPSTKSSSQLIQAKAIKAPAGESVLDLSFATGAYYITPASRVEESPSPGAKRLRSLAGGLRVNLHSSRTPPETLKRLTEQLEGFERYDALILIDEVGLPRITDSVGRRFEPGYAIGRAYLIDYVSGRAVCFAPVRATNHRDVKVEGYFNKAFLEADLASAVIESADQRWVAARYR
jgi:hypothetical protein